MNPEAYESILVSCPHPAGQHMGQMTVAEFRIVEPELAEKVINPLVNVAVALEQSGMDERTAADMAFKAVAVTSEEGDVKRADPPKPEVFTDRPQAVQEPAEDKKKLALLLSLQPQN